MELQALLNAVEEWLYKCFVNLAYEMAATPPITPSRTVPRPYRMNSVLV